MKTNDRVHIAHHILGGGPPDLVFVAGWAFNAEALWDWPQAEAAARRLASFSRLILLDRRGTGLSDRRPDIANVGVDVDPQESRGVARANRTSHEPRVLVSPVRVVLHVT